MGDLVHISELTRRIARKADADLESAMADLEEARRHLESLERDLNKHIDALEETLSRDSDTDNGGAA